MFDDGNIDEYMDDDCTHEKISSEGYCIECGMSISGCGKLVSEDNYRDTQFVKSTNSKSSVNKDKPVVIYGNAKLKIYSIELAIKMNVPSDMVEQLKVLIDNNVMEVRGGDSTLNKMIHVYMCYLYRFNNVKCTPERLLSLCGIQCSPDDYKDATAKIMLFHTNNTFPEIPNKLNMRCMLKDYKASMYIEEFLHMKNGGDLGVYNSEYIYPDSHKLIIDLCDELTRPVVLEGLRRRVQAAAVLMYCRHINDYRTSVGKFTELNVDLIYSKVDIYEFFGVTGNTLASAMSKLNIKILSIMPSDDVIKLSAIRTPRSKKITLQADIESMDCDDTEDL